MKKRSWIYIGHNKGTNEKDRELGSFRFINPVTKAEAFRQLKKIHPAYIISKVR